MSLVMRHVTLEGMLEIYCVDFKAAESKRHNKYPIIDEHMSNLCII